MNKTILGVILALFFSSGSVQATLISTFDSGGEGWSVTDGARNGMWNSSGGNPNGYISAEDGQLGNTWYIKSPNSWAGDWSSYIGGTVSFDLIDIEQAQEDYIFGGHGSFYDAPAEIVIIMNSGNKALWQAIIQPDMNEWKHFQISLLESTAILSGIESFETIMSNVTQLRIRGEYYKLDDKTGLDNVMVKAVPEPATLVLMSLGLAGIGCRRRKDV